MLNQEKEKPPTQEVGVAGFKADLYVSDIKKIDWYILIHLPKFQMYAVEVSGRQYGHVGNVMEWIMGYVQDRIQSNGEQWLFDAYSKWHDEKGYWEHETVYGELI